MEEDDDIYQVALSILVETGNLTECEFHAGTYTSGDDDLTSAYKLANYRITKGEIVLPSRYSRTDFTDIVKSAFEDNNGLDGCPSCEKMFGN